MRKYSLKKEIVFTFIGICVLAFVLVYNSYKDFYGASYSNKTILDSTIGMKGRVSDSSSNKDVIFLSDKLKMSDEEGINQEAYNVQVTNKNNYAINYNIYIKKDVYINKDNSLNDEYIHYSLDDNKGLLNDLASNNYIIYSGVLKSGEKRDFSLRLWVDNNYNEDNKGLYLSVYVNYVTNDNLYSFLESKVSKSDNYYIDTDEAFGMYKFAKSDRFIGNVSHNYIYFNCQSDEVGSCELWRIVGIGEVILDNFKTAKRVKIVRDSLSKDVAYYDNLSYYSTSNLMERFMIKDGSTYKKSYVTLLSDSDYRYSFAKGVNNLCYNDISKCTEAKSSYLYKGKKEWLLNSRGVFNYISDDGKVMSTGGNVKLYFRPVVYLKKNIKLRGGDGSIEMPYIIY